jgi:hypothetical protein
MNTKPKKASRKRVKLNRYRVWFKDGTSVVVLAQYQYNAYDMLPIEQRMQISRIVDDVE